MDRKKTWARSWYQNLQFQIALLFVILGGGLVLVTRNIIETHGHQQFNRYTEKILILNGENIVENLGQNIRSVEATARAMALLGSTLDPDDEKFRTLIPALLESGSEATIIAGGGIWPEPFRVAPGRERASLFWGGKKAGKLTFYDDYNRPDVPPYFGEEWYVPATYLHEGQAYWSRSYIDPYSNESMTTCTVPYFRGVQLAGVVTVDVTLAGLSEYFRHQADLADMYVFALDRLNRFLNFPLPDLILPDQKMQPGQTVRSLKTATEVAQESPAFRAMADTLNAMMDRGVAHSRKKFPVALENISREISTRITAIDRHEAELIASQLLQQSAPATSLPRIHAFQADAVIDRPTTAVIMTVPHTSWRIVVVVPSDAATARVRELSNDMTHGLIDALLLCILLISLCVRLFLIGPIGKLLALIRDKPDNTGQVIDRLQRRCPNEIGELAGHFVEDAETLRTVKSAAAQTKSETAVILAGLSYEFRRPVADILDANTAGNVQSPRVIRNASTDLMNTINDVLDLARIMSGRFVVERVPFEIVSTIANCQQLCASEAKRRNIPIFFTNRIEKQCLVMGGGRHLRRVITHLLQAALYQATGGHIDLVLLNNPEQYTDNIMRSFWFEVHHQGTAGFEADPEVAFKAFRTLADGAAHHRENTGLGLVLSQEISKLLGGELTVITTAPDETVYRLSLSLPQAPGG